MAMPSDDDYRYLRAVVFRGSQNLLDPSCDVLFEMRLAGLLRAQRVNGLPQLVRRLRLMNDPKLEQAVAEAMTIKETSFFRDSRTFALLRRKLLPELAEARRTSRTLRLWSAACSTGQEAFSLAILLREQLGQDGAWSLRVDGTDISSDAIDRASRGAFDRIEMTRGLEEPQLTRYFEQAGEQWIARPSIRRLCRFRRANLCQEALPFRERFDLILLRNVMLYFLQETRQTVLARVHRMLAPDGILLLGSAEQPPPSSLWSASLAFGACYYRPQ